MLDADFAIAAAGGLREALRARSFQAQVFPRSINAQLPGSRLRLQITINTRYAGLPARAVIGRVIQWSGLGYFNGEGVPHNPDTGRNRLDIRKAGVGDPLPGLR